MIDQAKPQDADTIMPLMLSAIDSIAYTLSGTREDEETWRILADAIRQEDNRLSYRNIIVDRRDGTIAGMLICYAGDEAERLDYPIRERLARDHGPEAARALVPECRPGDFYLDAVAVDECYQGQGIAKALIRAFEQRGVEAGCARLSLIVEQYNDRARSLYEKLGYEEDGLLDVGGSSYTRMIKGN
ncbi:GNAT family N-acetyltransferase [Paenibacillus sp. 1011MAR3C5]|uniref:GNAT family N-acetyltransferase n=1 Tax=Paenibacillus sp. 1011MAR3C5 TaxID=1675787 RepID=UPI000E6C9DDB|nr:GNAT family N-acetyltransferase [Paenibacillus sp. 1011MAR3C5]RJE91240.1 GNAT family N-acetyltransferase [Paenibacillus sp. 1011MAR3C5]